MRTDRRTDGHDGLIMQQSSLHVCMQDSIYMELEAKNMFMRAAIEHSIKNLASVHLI